MPAGAYEYKVAINRSWTENYGAGGAPGGANIPLTAPGGTVTFTYDDATHVISDDVPRPVGAERGAHWVRRGVIAWDLPDAREGFTYRLHAAPDGGMTVDDGAIAGGTSFPLTLDDGGLPADVRSDFPHLAAYEALELSDTARRRARALLRGQLAVAAYDASGALVRVTGVQIPGVLDDLYAAAARAELGPTWHRGKPHLAVWAPTAKNVTLLLGDRRVAMRRGRDGVWRAEGRKSWRGARYAFEVVVYAPTASAVVTNVVTDPYSLGLTTNSARSILVDLDSRRLRPHGWDRLRKPGLEQSEDMTIYELHVRDFSITDETVPAGHRGTYRAFTHDRSDGMRHLRGLADAGMTALHLLPTNDIATIEERRAAQQEPPCTLTPVPPDGEWQQECVGRVRDLDGFNWGYDPLHYTTPEGSYSTSPGGTARTREFREMVAGVNRAGLRVVMDVVYNHTPAAGQDPKSILDRIVPGYYHRLIAHHGRGRDLHLLLEHRERAPHDGEADGRVDRDLGARVQGRRLPLRPHGPPLAGQHARRAARARPPDRAPRRRRRPQHLHLRRGLELRRGGEQRALRAGQPAQPLRHRDRHVLRPAARRGARRRAVRRGPARAGLRQRAVHRSQRRDESTTARAGSGSSAPGCCSTTTRSRSGSRATCATTGSSTARARR